MWLKRFLLAVVLILIIAGQITMLGGFSWLKISVNLALVGVVLTVLVGDYPRALWVALLSGLVLDIYSSLPFGVFMLAYLIVAVILEFLFLNLFTNRSLYTLLSLGAVAAVSYGLAFLAISSLLYLVGLSDFSLNRGYGWDLLWQLVVTLVLLAGCFAIINRRSHRFKPIFLKS